MIGTLRGKLTVKSPDGIVIEAGGVGYEVSVPISVLSDLPNEGNNVFLYVHTNVRDDSIELYGFLDERGRRVFRTLLNVTGVGPRLALNILSGTSVDDFLHAIETEDIGLLTRLPGIGRKTAQRILFELSEKFPTAAKIKDRAYEDTLSALVNLGYKRAQANEALDRVYQEGFRDIESLLKETLKYLNR